MTIIRPKHYYFIGIGGISMSGIASVLVAQGNRVSGSDISDSPIIQRLKRQGIRINIGHNEENISEDIDFVVTTAAIPPNNLELKKAKKLKIPIIKRSQMIGELMVQKYGIAVSGMHGKTTVTSMLTLILKEAGFDPTALIGSNLTEIGGNFYVGSSKYFVAEACEYNNSFLDFNPFIGIVTNIEPEHLDFFKNLDNIQKSFTKFLKSVNPEGMILANYDNQNIQKVLKNINHENIVTYGFDGNLNYRAFNIREKASEIVFDIRFQNKIAKDIKIHVPGEHNVLNATCAFALSCELGINIALIKEVLSNFKGAERRFELRGKINGINIIQDYAHHPSEIIATLEGARKFYPKGKLYCAFQPHQYKRTKTFLKDFARSFKNASLVIIPNIYKVSGRDTKSDIEAVSAEKLVQSVNKISHNAKFIDGFEKTAEFLSKKLKYNDTLIIMGAGDINTLEDYLLKEFDYINKYYHLKKILGPRTKEKLPLAKYTTFKIGGPADLFYEARNMDELKNAVKEARGIKIPYMILGGGSNILISDNGFKGLVIKNSCKKIKIDHNKVISESGVALSELVSKTQKIGLSGFEFGAGIPGTIGGAVWGNAGLPKKSIGDILVRALVLKKDNTCEEVKNDYFRFKYRKSFLKRNENRDIILKAEFVLTWENPQKIKESITSLITERRTKQPLSFASVGSIFKNPSQRFAGELLEKVGAKKMRVGKAQVSPKHANFIINMGGAKASDVKELIEKLKDKVKNKFSINLQEEINYVGEW